MLLAFRQSLNIALGPYSYNPAYGQHQTLFPLAHSVNVFAWSRVGDVRRYPDLWILGLDCGAYQLIIPAAVRTREIENLIDRKKSNPAPTGQIT